MFCIGINLTVNTLKGKKISTEQLMQFQATAWLLHLQLCMFNCILFYIGRGVNLIPTGLKLRA